MNTQALNSLADLICRAQTQNRTPMGIAFAIDAAGRHMSPETAAELERLRARVAELEAERDEDEAGDEDPIAYALTEDVAPQVRKLRGILARQREDAYQSPLHHDYALGHDLPEMTP